MVSENMIMMRSTPVTKMGKPPPPVPPRPSKTLVAEALAKTRGKGAPTRLAPPPPNDINRSTATINVNTNTTYDDGKPQSQRTVIFQSPRPGGEPVSKPGEVIETKKEDAEEKDSGKEEKWDLMLNDRNHVNTLIDEMFASVLEVSTVEEERSVTSETSSTVVVIDEKSTLSIERKKVQFDDQLNHELLISELENLRMEDEKIAKRQRMPSKDIYENSESGDVSKIQHSDWVEVSDGQEVRLSSCQITINDLKCDEEKSILKLDYDRIKKMSSLHGLPPLPKSLSGFNILENQTKPPTPVRTSSIRGGQAGGHLVYPPHPKINGEQTGRKSTSLDTQLAILRREMYSLRQLDLSLLSQLWSLNESIQDFRQILQDQEDRVLSPPSPSPNQSSGDEGDGDEFYVSTSSMNFRTPPPPVPVRRPSSSSNASSLG